MTIEDYLIYNPNLSQCKSRGLHGLGIYYGLRIYYLAGGTFTLWVSKIRRAALLKICQ